jgi:hypothetical protein
VIDNDFLFKDEHAEKASKHFGKLSGCPQPLKERIGLSAKYAQYYRLPPDDPERTSRELLDKLLEFGKHQQLLLERASFLEAVYLRWFNWALDDQNLAILQNVYALLPKEKWCKAEVDALSTLRRMYTEKVQNLADLTSEALKKGEQIEQHPVGLAAKLIKNLQKQPSIEDALLEWDGLIDDLRTWIVKTRRAGWSEEAFRLESYLEKLTKQYGRVELLIKRKMSETNLVLIGELWKLALPGTPEDPEGEPKQTPKASDANRLQWLMQMEKACLDLLKTYPKDSQTKAWLSWQSRIQTEIRKIQKP